MFKGKIQRFVILPICSVYDDEGNLIREEKVKGITAYIGDVPDLKKLAETLEKKLNDDYFSRLHLKKTNNR
jgi:hypothetical protein